MTVIEELRAARYAVNQGIRVSRFLTQAFLGNAVLGRRPNESARTELPSVGEVLADMRHLFERDWANIAAKVYRLPEDNLDKTLPFALSTFRVFRDLWKVRRRQRDQNVQEIETTLPKEQFPRYFTQTFHYQTDGYLSRESADLYDHQVEMVFAGGADAMRRQSFPFLKNYFEERKALDSAKPIEVLDVACGTGRYLRFLKENAPEIKLTGLDLSPYYLKKARADLTHYDRVDFVEGNAESMPFRDAHFDALSCIYLFHELPPQARERVASELARVLKPGGLLVVEDSLQLGDKPLFDSSLEQFPLNYHEPYFLNYIRSPLMELFDADKWELRATDMAFF